MIFFKKNIPEIKNTSSLNLNFGIKIFLWPFIVPLIKPAFLRFPFLCRQYLKIGILFVKFTWKDGKKTLNLFYFEDL